MRAGINTHEELPGGARGRLPGSPCWQRSAVQACASHGGNLHQLLAPAGHEGQQAGGGTLHWAFHRGSAGCLGSLQQPTKDVAAIRHGIHRRASWKSLARNRQVVASHVKSH